MIWFFVFFFISGFCSILYEMIWLRLSMAQFGVTTALVSIVLSTFMGGLGAGSWVSGRLIRRYEGRINFPPLRLYALSELLIGASAVLVPFQLLLGHRLVERMGEHVAVRRASTMWCRAVADADFGAVVRVHGGDDSAGDVGDPQRCAI